jgi:hypothetical protein
VIRNGANAGSFMIKNETLMDEKTKGILTSEEFLRVVCHVFCKSLALYPDPFTPQS